MPREQLLSAPTQEYAKSQETRICDLCYTPALVLTPRRNSYLCPGCYARTPISAPELAARFQKAMKIAGILADCGGDAKALNTMTEADWQLAANAAHVNIPSLETRSVVASILQRASRSEFSR